jgi:hypothetical protein
MSRGSLRLLGLAGLLLAVAPAVLAQEDAVLKSLTEAKKLQGEGRTEDAAIALRTGRVQLRSVADAAVQRSLQKSIDTLLAEVDTLAVEAGKAEEVAARALLKAAQNYLRRKWTRAALPLLELAAELSDKIAGKALQQAGVSDQPATNAVATWFGDGMSFCGGGYWTVDKGTLKSPQLKSDSIGFRSKKTTSGPVRIEMEALATAQPCKLALVFALDASTDGDDYYILELRHERGFSQLRLLHNDGTANRLDEILTQPLTMSRAERTTWTTLWAELRGDRIRIGIGDIESAESKAVTKDLDGCIGVFVSGDSSFKAPVQFRNLRVDGL